MESNQVAGTLSIVDIATILVAVYGAALSTYNLVVDIRKNRRLLKVKLCVGFTQSLVGTSETLFMVDVRNSGQRTITVTSVSLVLPNGLTGAAPITQGSHSMPCELSDGKNCTFWYDIVALSQSLIDAGFSGIVKVKARVGDGSGEYHTSKPYKLDVDGWAKSKQSR